MPARFSCWTDILNAGYGYCGGCEGAGPPACSIKQHPQRHPSPDGNMVVKVETTIPGTHYPRHLLTPTTLSPSRIGFTLTSRVGTLVLSQCVPSVTRTYDDRQIERRHHPIPSFSHPAIITPARTRQSLGKRNNSALASSPPSSPGAGLFK